MSVSGSICVFIFSCRSCWQRLLWGRRVCHGWLALTAAANFNTCVSERPPTRIQSKARRCCLTGCDTDSNLHRLHQHTRTYSDINASQTHVLPQTIRALYTLATHTVTTQCCVSGQAAFLPMANMDISFTLTHTHTHYFYVSWIIAANHRFCKGERWLAAKAYLPVWCVLCWSVRLHTRAWLSVWRNKRAVRSPSEPKARLVCTGANAKFYSNSPPWGWMLCLERFIFWIL